MAESIQHKLSRERPPRVQITYDVETGNSIVKTELPFVVGVIADLAGNVKDTARKKGDVKMVMRRGKAVEVSGKPITSLVARKEYADRDFTEISRDNFDKVLADIAPRLSLTNLKKLPGDVNSVDLAFNCIEDFRPDSIIANCPILKKLLDQRNAVRDHYTVLDLYPSVQQKLGAYLADFKPVESGGKNGGNADVSPDQLFDDLQTASGTAGDLTNLMQTDVEAFVQSAAAAKDAAENQEEDAETKRLDAVTKGKAAVESVGTWSEAVTNVSSAAGEIQNYNKTIAEIVKKFPDAEDFFNKINDAHSAAQKMATDADTEAKKVKTAAKDIGDSVKADALADEATAIDTAMKTAVDKLNDFQAAAATLPPLASAESFPVLAAFQGSPLADKCADMVDYFSSNAQQLSERYKVMGNVIKMLIAEVAAKDRALGQSIDEILHHKDFQSLEASWRGLHYFVYKTSTGTMLRIKVLDATLQEIKKNIEGASDFDQSFLFKKIYEETYGTMGGSPYSCLIMDHYFGTEDVDFLQELITIAAAAHAPLLTAPSSSLFGLTDAEEPITFEQIASPRTLDDVFRGGKYIGWTSLRESEDSRYLNMVMPRFLLRCPYVQADVESFSYIEQMCAPEDVPEQMDDDVPVPPPVHQNYLWGNAAYALGERITYAFSLYKWTAAIRGMEGGGLVENLPVHTFTRSSGDLAVKFPTEITITDRREKELSDLGFIALCYRLETDKAVFFGGQTVNKPIAYMDASATANAILSARLPYILNASRFAHYIKCIMRDKIGSFLDRDTVESFLNNWLSNYVLLSDVATQNVKASYPLREGRVDVTDDPSRPGSYSAIMYLRPHFQMEDLEVSIRLVSQLPAPAV